MAERRPESLAALLSYLKDEYYGDMLRKMEHIDAMYEQDYASLFTVEYTIPISKTSTSSSIVDGFRNQLRTDEPTVEFRPYGASRQAVDHASLMQQWGYGQLRREREMAEVDPNLQFGFDLLLRGAACKKILLDVDAVPERPVTRAGTKKYKDWADQVAASWPFIIRAIDPLSVFPSPGFRKPLRYIIEEQVRQAIDMWENYPDWADPNAKTSEGRNPARKVSWIEYWSPEWYIVEADGAEVFVRPNPYGFIPYVYEFSGLGRRHADGNPSHLAVSILERKLGDLEEEVRQRTAFSVSTMSHVFPTILTTGDPTTVATQFGMGPGRVIKHPPGQPPVYMEAPPPNENVLRFLAQIQGSIAELRSASLIGSREPGVDTASQHAQMTGQALTNLRPIREVLNRVGSQSLNMMSRMMRQYDLSMTVEGHGEEAERSKTVLGSDFTHYNFEVTFEAIDPAEDRTMMLVGEALRRAGDLSQRTFWKKFAKHVIEDADEEEANLLVELIMRQMAESGMLTQIVLSEERFAEIMEQQSDLVEQARSVIQQRRNETVPQVAGEQASQLDALAGTPGLSNVPRAISEQAMAAGVER